MGFVPGLWRAAAAFCTPQLTIGMTIGNARTANVKSRSGLQRNLPVERGELVSRTISMSNQVLARTDSRLPKSYVKLEASWGSRKQTFNPKIDQAEACGPGEKIHEGRRRKYGAMHVEIGAGSHELSGLLQRYA